jgi:hypothetical protein
MNKRIKELKHQASLWCDRNIPEQYSEETNSYGTAWEDKFAELIVKECIDQISVNHDPNSDWDWEVSRGHAIAIIKEHFGV